MKKTQPLRGSTESAVLRIHDLITNSFLPEGMCFFCFPPSQRKTKRIIKLCVLCVSAVNHSTKLYECNRLLYTVINLFGILGIVFIEKRPCLESLYEILRRSIEGQVSAGGKGVPFGSSGSQADQGILPW